jgi:hypothetical protein
MPRPRGKSLSNLGVSSPRDIQFSVPSLVYNNAALGGQPYLRGIGSTLYGQISTQLLSPILTVWFWPAIRRKLTRCRPHRSFGRTAGHALWTKRRRGHDLVVTLTPSSKLEAQANVSYGNYNDITADGYVSGGVSDRFQIGVYGRYTRFDPYDKQLTPGLNEPNHESDGAVRLKAVWEPSGPIKLTADGPISEKN